MKKYRIQVKYAEEVLCPANAIEEAFYADAANRPNELITMDGVEVKATFVRTWRGESETLNRECVNMLGRHFDIIRSLWFGRLGAVDNYWHLIKLERI